MWMRICAVLCMQCARKQQGCGLKPPVSSTHPSTCHSCSIAYAWTMYQFCSVQPQEHHWMEHLRNSTEFTRSPSSRHRACQHCCAHLQHLLLPRLLPPLCPCCCPFGPCTTSRQRHWHDQWRREQPTGLAVGAEEVVVDCGSTMQHSDRTAQRRAGCKDTPQHSTVRDIMAQHRNVCVTSQHQQQHKHKQPAHTSL